VIKLNTDFKVEDRNFSISFSSGVFYIYEGGNIKLSSRALGDLASLISCIQKAFAEFKRMQELEKRAEEVLKKEGIL